MPVSPSSQIAGLGSDCRILIFRIGELGDAVVALPAIQAVRQQFQAAHIALLGNHDANQKHVTPNQVLPVGLIDEWISYPVSDSGTNTIAKFELLRRLRKGRYDVLFYLAPRARTSASTRRDLLFFKLAGIKTVVGSGIVPLPRGDKPPLPLIEHEADHLLGRLAVGGIDVPLRGKARFDLALTDKELASANEWIDANLKDRNRVTLVGVGPGSKWPSKIWPEADYEVAVSRLLHEYDESFPIVFGGPDDRLCGDRLVRRWGRGANAAGALSPREAAAALSRCQLYLGNDTGTMHLAAAVGTRCVVPMSAQDWPGRWHPYGERHIVLRKRVECEGCMLKICEREALRCLTGISVDEVVEACMQVVSNDAALKPRSELVTVNV